jgi:Ketopantoate reductase
MKIAVLGSGNGGCAVAFDWAKAGHDVYLCDFPQFPQNIEAINQNGGIYEEIPNPGFGKVAYAGFDFEKAIENADLIFAVGPAYSTGPFGKACKPYLKKGQIVVVCPSSCGGAIVFKNAIGLPVGSEDIIVAETSTLPYAVRLTGPGRIRVFLRLKHGLLLSALPSKLTGKIYDMIKPVHPAVEKAKNVFQTTLQNGNPSIHPAVTLLNASLVERTKGDFFFYEDGVTQASGRLIKALDDEKIAIGRKLGFEIVPDPEIGMRQGYMAEPTYDTGYSKAPGFKGIKAPDTLDYRYFNEDVGFGLVFISELGKQVGVPTPAIDAVIKIVSVIMNRDYRAEEARTMKSMGLGDYTMEEIIALI